ncbi:MAG: Gfo/Idh/MocA family oxidoreductase [Flavobacteriaceae bacterium]
MVSRRNFMKNLSAIGLGAVALPHSMMGFSTASKEDKLKLGIIGVGLRGTEHLRNLLLREDIEVLAICDIDSNRLKIADELIQKAGRKPVRSFGSDELDYRNLLNMDELDAVIIATPWSWHVPMSVDAMRAKKYTGVEVSAATTLEGCWELVNTHLETGTHLMILENVNYRRDVLAVLNMVKKGIFGELVHFRCGYQHDLREVKFNNGKQPYGGGVEFGENALSEAKWRTAYSVNQNADVYPTHGLGPVAVMADINRGNRFLSVSSYATKAIGLHNHILDVGGPEHPNAKVKFKQGDVITSTIRTARDETIIVTHDCNLPRPYSLGFRVQGANGIWEVDGNRIYIQGESPEHRWEDASSILERYDHPLWKKYGELATGSGHGGMDFFVLNAFVEAARRRVAPPLDVYDAAAWSALTPLSERSIAQGGAPQDFPDFTKGSWESRPTLNWLSDRY